MIDSASRYPSGMLRTLLLLACLLRLAPAPGMAASHCAPVVAGGVHQHGAAHHEAQTPEHRQHAGEGDCAHCPPSQCAQVASCGVTLLTGTAAESSCFGVTARAAQASPADALTWASADHPPPTRPPASLLA
ncbi:MAG: hypothetical protein IPP98_08230 [Gemmatimonadetes bacterium]|nr:hypothetical protein [Gemmatimonadota bacterium]